MMQTHSNNNSHYNVGVALGPVRDVARLYNQCCSTGAVNQSLVHRLLEACELVLKTQATVLPDVGSAVSRALTHALVFSLHNEGDQVPDQVYSALRRWIRASVAVPGHKSRDSA